MILTEISKNKEHVAPTVAERNIQGLEEFISNLHEKNMSIILGES